MAAPEKTNAQLAAKPMAVALGALLDGVAGSRRVFRHLAAIEHQLATKDASGTFLFEAPLDSLKTALHQLESVLTKPVPEALHQLLLTLFDAIQAKEHAARRSERNGVMSSFFVDHKLQVSEGRNTDFAEVHAAWMAEPPVPPKPKPAPEAKPSPAPKP